MNEIVLGKWSRAAARPQHVISMSPFSPLSFR
jgi:hypothetical protein